MRDIFDARFGDEVEPTSEALKQGVFGKDHPGTGRVKKSKDSSGCLTVRWPRLNYDSHIHTDWLILVERVESSGEELTEDHLRWLRERADERRKGWAEHRDSSLAPEK